MSEPILCKICGKRRARRACPAVQGDICTICCGTEREVSLSCPLECEYLREAHRHEKPVPISAKDISNRDIEVTEDFLHEHEELILFSIVSLVEAAERTGAIDSDVLAALEAFIKTYRTRESGLIYESTPENLIAAAVQREFRTALGAYEKVRQERGALGPLRNSDVLTALVFLYRMGKMNQNGRPRGRMYLDMLRQMGPESRVDERAPSIIL